MSRQSRRKAVTPVPANASSLNGGVRSAPQRLRSGGANSAASGKASTGSRRRERFAHRREGTGRKTNLGKFILRGPRSDFKVKNDVRRGSDGFEDVDEFWGENNKESKSTEGDKDSQVSAATSSATKRKSAKKVTKSPGKTQKTAATPHSKSRDFVKEKVSSIKKRRLTFEAEEMDDRVGQEESPRKRLDAALESASSTKRQSLSDDEDVGFGGVENDDPYSEESEVEENQVPEQEQEESSSSSEDEDDKRRAGHTDDSDSDSSSDELPTPEPKRASSSSSRRRSMYVESSEEELEVKPKARKRTSKSPEDDESYSSDSDSSNADSDDQPPRRRRIARESDSSESESSESPTPRKPKRIRKVIPPSVVPDDEEGTPGLRRSKRRRWAPLQHWKGERLVLQRSQLEEDGLVVDEIAEVVAAEKPDLFRSPVAHKSRKRVHRSFRPAPAGQVTHVGKPTLDFVPSEPTEKVECLDVVSGKMVNKVVVMPSKDLYFQHLPQWMDGDGEEKYPQAEAASAFDDSQVVCGLVRIPPGGGKAPESTGRCTQVFFMSQGQEESLEVCIEDKHYVVSPGDQFLVPAHVSYSLRNMSVEFEATVSFMLVKPSVSHATPASARAKTD